MFHFNAQIITISSLFVDNKLYCLPLTRNGLLFAAEGSTVEEIIYKGLLLEAKPA